MRRIFGGRKGRPFPSSPFAFPPVHEPRYEFSTSIPHHLTLQHTRRKAGAAKPRVFGKATAAV